jgi:predicted MFS family arabinose efflux permease
VSFRRGVGRWFPVRQVDAPGRAAVESSLWRLPAIRELVLLTLLGFTGFSATLASLPWWAFRAGASPSAAGLVTTVMLGVTVVVQFLVPAVERRLGTGRTLAIGLLALGAPSAMYLLSTDLVPMLVVSAVRGVGFGVLTVMGAALTAVLVPPGRHGEAVGLYGLAVAAPNLLVVPGAVALAQNVAFWPVVVLATCPVLAVPLALAIGADHQPRVVHEKAGRRRAALTAVLPSVVLLTITFAGGGVTTYLPIERPNGYLATLGLLLFGLTAALGRWRVGRFADRSGTRLLLPGAVLVGVVGLAVLAAGLWRGVDVLLLAGAAVFGTAYGAVQNLTLVVAFARARGHGASTVSAVWNAAFDMGTGIGAVVVGALAATGMGVPMALGACAAFIAVSLPLAVVASARHTPGAA